MFTLSTLKNSLLALSCLPLISLPAIATSPPSPALTFLYTAYVECDGNLMRSEGPYGTRMTIPIVGGNFTGPHLSGTILNVGADWGVVDPQTKIFSADTRYNLRTNDGEGIFIRTSGPTSPSGPLHLRLIFETGSRKYYWLNHIIAIGTLTPVKLTATGSTLRIDAWNMASDWNSTSVIFD
ncbi:hypothetical protein FE257_004983 [Aspergillus nanangensis]|uniref:Uncharacterized protein n=1 Tax=Aspergillus nanangensis TaxID=2582783 RepID=A0AAD4CSN5_ASPNN|nr:hypothetical protein FE257_004983 [Aspergillus nanangensis]